MTYEDFEELKRAWTALASSQFIDSIRLRCVYCGTDLTDELAFVAAEVQVAVCRKHAR